MPTTSDSVRVSLCTGDPARCEKFASATPQVHPRVDRAAYVAQHPVRPKDRNPDISGSEITGPAFSADGTRLSFSSQRNPGETFEVTGPWNTNAPTPA